MATEYDYTPKTEEEGSSAKTAVAVGAGALIAVAAVVAAPVLLPAAIFGGAALAVTAVGAPLAAAVGGYFGWMVGGKK